MSRSFLDPQFRPPETSAQLVFSGGRLDRLSEEREESCVQDAWDNPATKMLGFARGRALIRFEGENARCLFDADELKAFGAQAEKTVMLGFDNGSPRLAVPLSINPDEEDFSLPEPFKAIDYRSIALQGLLEHEAFGDVAYGGALLAWHAMNRFCARCGSPSEIRAGGAKRQCTQCEKEHFPRTDPVVIMLAVNGNKCLLGRSHHFPTGMYSALAGFVEAGETMESAVRRETFEESGIRIGKVTYHATQPWPFPHTLMIGCYGEALETNIVRDEGELDDCRWFTRDEVLAILSGNGPKNEDGSPALFMPPPMAIANRLVTDWAKS